MPDTVRSHREEHDAGDDGPVIARHRSSVNFQKSKQWFSCLLLPVIWAWEVNGRRTSAMPWKIAYPRNTAIDSKGLTMSPTYFAVQMARIDEELEAARQAGDFQRMQGLLAEATSLLRSMYGTLA
jgi:hypothetical protein